AALVAQYRNIDALKRFLRRFQVYLAGNIVNRVQVGQVEQQLLRSVDSILPAHANYRNALDQFKQQLGLPMNVNLELNEDPLKPVLDQTRRFEDISAAFEEVSERSLNYSKVEQVNEVRAAFRRIMTNSK